MVTVVALIKKPAKLEKFEEHFWRVHLLRARKLPGLRKITVHRLVSSLGGDSDLYGIVDLIFDSRDAYERALGSQEMGEATPDGSWLERETGAEMKFRYLCESTNVWIGGIFTGRVMKGRGLGAKAMVSPPVERQYAS